VDREAEARQIAEAAKRGRSRTPRWLLAVSIVVGATCCFALAIAWYVDRDTKAERAVPTAIVSTNGSFAAGLVVGAALGALATAAILLRKR
jgi:Na+/proline symporter